VEIADELRRFRFEYGKVAADDQPALRPIHFVGLVSFFAKRRN